MDCKYFLVILKSDQFLRLWTFLYCSPVVETLVCFIINWSPHVLGSPCIQGCCTHTLVYMLFLIFKYTSLNLQVSIGPPGSDSNSWKCFHFLVIDFNFVCLFVCLFVYVVFAGTKRLGLLHSVYSYLQAYNIFTR